MEILREASVEFTVGLTKNRSRYLGHDNVLAGDRKDFTFSSPHGFSEGGSTQAQSTFRAFFRGNEQCFRMLEN